MSEKQRTSLDPGLSRRDFIRSGTALSLGGLFLSPGGLAKILAAKQNPEALPYKVRSWIGDRYDRPHRFRDGFVPALKAASGKHDVVIVGGGIAGLSAAFTLRGLDTVVLEALPTTGGNCVASSYKGKEYNAGAAYFVTADGDQGALFAEAGIPLKPIREPADRYFLGGKWVPAPWSEESIAKQEPALRDAMRGYIKALTEITNGDDFPGTPYEESTAKALELDKIPFSTWLKPWAHPEMMKYLNSYCYSAMGASADEVSAYGGINFTSEFIGRLYTCDIGNAQITRALTAGFEKAGAGRVLPNCFVHRVEPKGSRVLVHYLKGEEPQAIEAKQVIISAPYYYANLLVPTQDAKQRELFASASYGGYVVAGLCFDKSRTFDTYDSWAGKSHFEDLIPTGWGLDEGGEGQKAPVAEKKAETRDEPMIISVFAGCRNIAEDRTRMLEVKPEDWAKPIVDEVLGIYPELSEDLREVSMSRFGHAIITNRPGYFTKWLPSLKKDVGAIHFAHSDGQGLPAVESATTEGLAAADKVKKALKK